MHQLDIIKDYELLYFHKNIKKVKYNTLKYYHYIIYVYMSNDYDYHNMSNSKIRRILGSFIKDNYYQCYLSYNNANKYYKIEYYTD